MASSAASSSAHSVSPFIPTLSWTGKTVNGVNTTGNITLNWTKVTNAVGYVVWENTEAIVGKWGPKIVHTTKNLSHFLIGMESASYNRMFYVTACVGGSSCSTSPGIYGLVCNNCGTASNKVSVKVQITDENEALKEAVDLTWNAVALGLSNKDRNVLNYFDAAVYEKYAEVFDILGDQVIEIGKQLKEGSLLSLTDKSATYLVRKTGDDGQSYVHPVLFIKDETGQWKINEL